MSPETAALNAVIAHLATGLGESARVREGWPEADALDLQSGPVVAIFGAGNVQWTQVTPELIGSTDTDTESACLYRIAQSSMRIQISLFAAYKAQRETVAESLEPLLDNLFPESSGLILLTEYYGQYCRFELETSSEQDGEGPESGEWRRDWVLSAQVEMIREQTHPLQLEGSAALTME